MLHLRIVRGPGDEDWVSVAEGDVPFTIGRDEANHLQIRSSTVSRFHAAVASRGGAHYIEDLGSTNGTLLNGKTVKRARISEGDKITVGNVEIFVEASAAPLREKPTRLSLPVSVEEPSTHRPVVALSRPAEELAAEQIASEPGRDERSRPRRILEILYKADRIARDIEDFNLMLENLMDLVLDALPASRGYLFLVENGTSDLVPYVRRAPQAAQGDTELVVSRTILRSAIERKEAVLSADALVDERFVGSQSVCELPVRSAMCVPLVARGSVLGVIYLDSSTCKNLYTRDDLALLSAIALKAAVSLDNARLYDDLRSLFYNTVETLIRAIQARDRYTSGHSARVTRYALLVADKLGFTQKEKHQLYLASILHDIGKIGIPDELLNREGKLTEEQMQQIRSHVKVGASMLKALGEMNPIVPLILHHHEAWDGSGYPDGLKGEEIPLMSRILAVADAYDAMTSDRPYRKARSVAETIEEIKRCAGRNFDPEIVKVFMAVLEDLAVVPTDAVPAVG